MTFSKGEYIHLSQNLSLTGGSKIDNERSGYTTMEIDGHGVFISMETNSVMFYWDQDGYIFLLSLNWENVTLDDAITIYRSIRPTA